MKFTQATQKIIFDIVAVGNTLRANVPHVRVVSFPQLRHYCTNEQRLFLKKFLELNPRKYGFRGPEYGITPPPKKLVTIRKELLPGTKKIMTRGVHYLPYNVYCAYRAQNRAMLRDIGRRVFVTSGYRSPAYQTLLFLEFLVKDEFDLRKTLTRIAFPGYSEHGAPKVQAIDFVTMNLEANSTANPIFEATPEYQWLLEHAHEYGFILSYPRGNSHGVAFEPWHWSYQGG